MASPVFQYTDYLQEIFPNKSVQTIEEVIKIVQNETPCDTPEYQLENVINLLTETGEQDFEQDENAQEDINEDGLLDEARGTTRRFSNSVLAMHFEHLLNIFPDACPLYIQNLVQKKSRSCINMDILLDEMTRVDYPKKTTDSKEIFENLVEMLPNADPSYLKQQAEILAHEPESKLKKFVEDAVEKNEYPTMEHYLNCEAFQSMKYNTRNKKESEEINKYTTDFSVRTFLKQFPDPEKYFTNPNRKSALLQDNSLDEEHVKENEIFAITFLYNHYNYLRRKDIEKVFKMCSRNLVKTCSKLDMMRKAMRTPRSIVAVEVIPKYIPLLQEVAYLKHRKAIKRILKEYDVNYRLTKLEAKKNGLLQTCVCCFDEELIPEECYFCKNGCIFCKDCVKGGTETAIGDGKLYFPCLADCDSEFSIPTLQMVLDSVVFSRLAQRMQMEEIKRANVDGLETCPFCDFATIPPPDDKIFKCLNQDCMKESCRECRHVAHIPLRCNEIEYDEDIKMRTYIENKMTEALLRKCWKCSKVFIKESGCNKMTCSCGAKMCYVCGAAVNDYTHFDSNNDSGRRCPLYTRDLNKFHAQAVIQGAVAAKSELGVDKNPNILKNDPSQGLADHYAVQL